MTSHPNSDAERAAADALDPLLMIDGAWQRGEGPEFEVVDPTTEIAVGRVASASPQQVAAAIEGARRSFDGGSWSRLAAADRSLVLTRASEALAAARESLIDLFVSETGCPVSLTRALQVDAMLEHFSWFAEAARRGPDWGFERALPVHLGPPASASALVREPIGVVAALTPYNIPLLTAAWKVGAALAAGCSAILAPSPRAALSTHAWVRALSEADLPPGTVSFVVGDETVGRSLTESPLVDMVSFTGSNAVGRHVMRQAAGGFKRLVLELGGKSPNLVLPGADVEAAAPPSILRFCRNAGQACGATTRTFVHRPDLDRYAAASRDFMSTLAIGDPREEKTVIGPLITAEHRDRVGGYVERALANGATIAAGGGRGLPAAGWFMEPLLVTDVSNRDEISRDELFGPVGVLIPYDDVEEAIKMANDSRYGLNANVWGATNEDALAVARHIRSGTVTINGGGGLRPDAPFGGYRESGLGREAGDAGLAEFLETKHLQWPVG